MLEAAGEDMPEEVLVLALHGRGITALESGDLQFFNQLRCHSSKCLPQTTLSSSSAACLLVLLQNSQGVRPDLFCLPAESQLQNV